MKKALLICLICTVTSPVCAQQKNRYGMKIEKSAAGTYTVDKFEQIGRLADLSRLPDLYLPYEYIPDSIRKDDYTRCRTVKYIYKTYDTHCLTMEVDLPLNGTGPYPFILYVHGGGWVSGNPQAWANQSKFMASKGIAGVRVSYTLNKDGGHFELGMQELNEAFGFIGKHAAAWNLDLSRYGLAGGSAGTPLACLLAMKKENCRLFIGCNGIYDFTGGMVQGNFPGKNPYLRYICTEEKKKAVSAAWQVPPVNPPAVLVVHGMADVTIPYQQSAALSDSVTARGGKAVKLIYPYYVHSFFSKNASDKYEEVTWAMYRFARDVFDNL